MSDKVEATTRAVRLGMVPTHWPNIVDWLNIVVEKIRKRYIDFRSEGVVNVLWRKALRAILSVPFRTSCFLGEGGGEGPGRYHSEVRVVCYNRPENRGKGGIPFPSLP